MIPGKSASGREHPRVAIHQPNFLPWAGYFQKIQRADIFIFLDTAQYTKNSFQNRVKILTRTGPRWLTIPVQTRGNFGIQTKDLQISLQTNWRRKHLATLRQNYAKAPSFKEVFPILEKLYTNPTSLLAEFNIQIVETLCRFMNIHTPFLRASQLDESGTSTQRLISLVKAVHGSAYLSGQGGKKYQDESLFNEEGIQLIYLEYDLSPYKQLQSGFISGLSIIDALFAMGKSAAAWIRGEKHEK